MNSCTRATQRQIYQQGQNRQQTRQYGSNDHPSPLYADASRQSRTNTVVIFVPQQSAYIVERFGKYSRTLEPGLAFLFPIVDKISYVKNLKEIAMDIPSQSAITLDNVTLDLDGVLYYRVVDPYRASYGVEDAEYAVSQLAQTTMRSEIGQLTLDHVLKERQNLNVNITAAINDAATDWGVKCLRYEIRDIHPPKNVLLAMHRQVSAERSKRAEILESEGQRQAAINIAEGQKQSTILASEADKAKAINIATGNAESILLNARASAEGLDAISRSIQKNGSSGRDAVALKVAEKYVSAFGELAKKGTTIVVPSGMNDMGGMIASAMGIYNTISKTKHEDLLLGSEGENGQVAEQQRDAVRERADAEMRKQERLSAKELTEDI